jgi:hypothetical protein
VAEFDTVSIPARGGLAKRSDKIMRHRNLNDVLETPAMHHPARKVRTVWRT